jgi:hypothetical protein
MDTLVHAAEAILRRATAPALRLTDLLRELRAEARDLSLDSERLLIALRARPDLFRILDPWRGPWRFIREPAAGLSGPGLDPWIVVVSDPAEQEGAGGAAARRLVACVRWLARGVDGRSPRALARWSALVLAAEEARGALDRAA